MPVFSNKPDEANTWENANSIDPAATGYMHGFADVDWFRLDVPRGTVEISVLPDLARIIYPASAAQFIGVPGDTPILQEETTIAATLFEHVIDAGKHGVLSIGTLTAKKDDLAVQGQTTLGPVDFLDGTFTLQGPRTVGGTQYTGEYYLQVNGQAVPLLNGSGDPYGLDRFTPEAGRYLITTGNPTGQRSATWGGWIDTFNSAGEGNGPTTSPPGDDVGTAPIPSQLPTNAQWNGASGGTFGQHEQTRSPTYSYNQFTDTWSVPGPPALGADLSFLGKGLQAFLDGMGEEATRIAINYIAEFAPGVGLSAEYAENLIEKIKSAHELYSSMSSWMTDIFEDLNHYTTALASTNVDGNAFEQSYTTRTGVFLSELLEQVPTGSEIGDEAVSRMTGAYRFSVGHSDISFAIDVDSRAAPTPLTAASGHSDGFAGGGGNDRFDGGDLDDFIYGAGGNDDLRGGTGSDVLIGGKGDDSLTGGDGGDRIWGNDGNDTMTGGPGNDTMDGGNGDDTVVLSGNFSQYGIFNWLGGLQTQGPDGIDNLRAIEHVRFADGSVGFSPGSAVFDAVFYNRVYADIFHANIDARAHYDQFGWKEGRDPDSLFSTKGYLATNKDVKAAGINPLDHYHQHGWKEGRDPGPNFDTTYYLKYNPDVQAAGIDPLEHYLQYGLGEGRPSFQAIGTAVSGFDAEYYLFQNPDVAGAGIDPLQHYNQYGWKEGRNPNPYFDSSDYLARYTDVKNAGINPLAHYEQFGWKEGRDPSFAFDTLHYLSAYPDVKNAGINPLDHFLNNGIYEGRSAFGDGVLH